MEENNTLGQQSEDTMLYPLVDSSLEKDLSMPSGSTPSVNDLINPNKDNNSVCLSVSSTPEMNVIPQQLSSAIPAQQVVSTSITTSGSNPLQVSVKTVPGANTIVNQALINNIVNTEAVQMLLRDNPGQPITIVRMPETVQLPKLNFPFTPLNNFNLSKLKARKRNGTTLPLRGKRARKHNIGGTQEEKTSFLQFQKSLQVKTRSGRVSQPPLYRVKETLRPKSGAQSNKPKDVSATEASGANTSSEHNSSPLDATGHTTASTATIRGQHSARRGHRGFRGYSRGRRRARSRIGNFGTRSSVGEKLKALLSDIPEEDFISLAVPRLSEILSPWDFLLMRAFKKRKTEPDKISFEVLLKEFEDMLKSLKALSKDCLHSERLTPDQLTLNLSGELISILGTSKGFTSNIRKENLPASVLKLMEATLETGKPTTEEEPADNDKSDSAFTQRLNQTARNTKIGDKILGVDTIFPDHSLKTSASNCATETAAATKLSVPNMRRLVDVEPCVEASVDANNMIVNVEELDSSVLQSGASDLNLNQAVQPTDSSVPLESGDSTLHVTPNALSMQASAGTLTEAAPLQEPSHALSDPLPTEASTLSAETVQDDSEVIQDMGPEALPSSPVSLQPATAPVVPEGSTILQMADGNFLVQKPDGTAMQIQAPEGMSIETIQALLTVETEVFDQGEPERPGVPAAMESAENVPFLSVEDSVAS